MSIFNINTHFGQRLTSAMLNEKTMALVGTNTKLSNAEARMISDTQAEVTPGTVLINGTLISFSSPLIYGIEETSGNTIYMSLKYDHQAISVSLDKLANSNEATQSHIILGVMHLENGKIKEVVNYSASNPIGSVMGQVAEMEARRIRNTVPSGFVSLGKIAAKNTTFPNTITLETESTAYVAGYEVVIPANTCVDLGESDASKERFDFVFLEAWKDIDFNISGQLHWRIRCVGDVDFDIQDDFFKKGFGWRGQSKPYICNTCCQGGNSSPLSLPDNQTENGDEVVLKGFCTPHYRKTTSRKSQIIHLDDAGLFIAGTGSESSKNSLKTIDGRCYAIPMFKVLRKANAPELIPFEHNKKHPVASVVKFNNLMSQKGVERVVNEVMFGETLKNLITPEDFVKNSPSGGVTINEDKSMTLTGMIANCYVRSDKFKPDTEYTLVVNVSNVARTSSQGSRLFSLNFMESDMFADELLSDIKTPGLYVAKTKTKEVFSGNIAFNSIWDFREGECTATVMAFEGHLQDSRIPLQYVDGVKSLGETENNLIMIKQSVAEPTCALSGEQTLFDCYDGITSFSTGNIVTASVEKDLISGENITPIIGNEFHTSSENKVRLSRIKGKTIHNLFSPNAYYDALGKPTTIIKSGPEVRIELQQNSQAFVSCFSTNCIAKNQDYTVIMDIDYNVSMLGVSLKVGSNFGSDLKFVQKGLNIFKIKTESSGTDAICIGHHAETTAGSYIHIKRFMFVEGDWTLNQSDLPHYFTGVKSAGEDEGRLEFNTLSSTGDVCNKTFYLNEPLRSLPIGVQDTINEYGIITRRIEKVVLNGSETWVLDTTGPQSNYARFNCDSAVLNGDNYLSYICDKLRVAIGITYEADEICLMKNLVSICINKSNLSQVTPEAFKQWLSANAMTLYYQLEIPKTESLIRHTISESMKSYQLGEPLRGISYAKDSINNNELVRNCGEIVLRGKEDWRISGAPIDENTVSFSHATSDITVDPNDSWEFAPSQCDRFVPIGKTQWYANPGWEGCCISSGKVYIRILKSKLETPDIEGFKKWLESNNTKVIYPCKPRKYRLREVSSSDTDFTPGRYCKEGNFLRRIPGGVSDEIVGDKVIRRVGRVVLNGSEEWVALTDATATTHRTSFNFSEAKPSSIAYCKQLPFSPGAYEEREKFYITKTPNVSITILKHRCPNLDAFKTWLKANPIELIYERNEPREESISLWWNHMYMTPHDMDTYCGAIFIGDGRNIIEASGSLNPEVISQTKHRDIPGMFKGDCFNKSSAYGQEMQIRTSGKNKIYLNELGMTQGYMKGGTEVTVPYTILDQSAIRIKCDGQTGFACCQELFLKPNTNYWLHLKGGSTASSSTSQMSIYTYSDKLWGNSLGMVGANQTPKKITTDSTGKVIVGYYIHSQANTGEEFVGYDIMLSEGDTPSAYEKPEVILTPKYSISEDSVDDMRSKVSLTGFDYQELLNKSFDLLLRGEL